MNSARDEIIAILMDLGDGKTINQIPKKQVLQWMATDDVFIMGVVYHLIMNRNYASFIIPSLEFDDYHQFLMEFYNKCIKEDPQDDWAITRYTAGRDFTNWFISLWEDKDNIPRTSINELKNWLENVYLKGDEEIRVCVITAILEHLFVNKEIASYFKDWKSNFDLEKAYDEAFEYSITLGKRR